LLILLSKQPWLCFYYSAVKQHSVTEQTGSLSKGMFTCATITD
jgi:hypothetical protein